MYYCLHYEKFLRVTLVNLYFNSTLDRDSISNVLEQLHKKEIRTVNIIDLSSVTFVKPYGLVLLLQLFNYLDEINDIIFPNKYAAKTYMERANFFDAANRYVYLNSDILSLKDYVSRDNSNKSMLEITRIEEKRDINETLEAVYQQAYNILESELHYTNDDITDFLSILSEMLSNIPRHSESYGYVSAQRYRYAYSDNRYVSVCISDTGIGIKGSYEETHSHYISNWTDEAALALAVIEGESSKNRGGLGYKGVKEKVKNFGGSLYVRSGTADITINQLGNQQIVGNRPFFPGTQIEIILPQRYY